MFAGGRRANDIFAGCGAVSSCPGYLGLSEASPKTLRRAHAVHPISALQTEFSLWERSAEVEILPSCRELGIGFVPYARKGCTPA